MKLKLSIKGVCMGDIQSVARVKAVMSYDQTWKPERRKSIPVGSQSHIRAFDRNDY